MPKRRSEVASTGSLFGPFAVVAMFVYLVLFVVGVGGWIVIVLAAWKYLHRS